MSPLAKGISCTGRDDDEEEEDEEDTGKKDLTPMSNTSNNNEFAGVLSVPLVKASLVHTLKLMDTGRANRRSKGHVAAAGSPRDTGAGSSSGLSMHGVSKTFSHNTP